jgi:hypothetical protein
MAVDSHAGALWAAPPSGVRRPVRVCRLAPNGRLDTRYGRGGVARLTVGGNFRPRAIAVDRKGRAVLAGTYRAYPRSSRFEAAIRINARGQWDSGLARRGGRLAVRFGEGSEASATGLLLSRNGRRLTLAGWYRGIHGQYGVGLARYRIMR